MNKTEKIEAIDRLEGQVRLALQRGFCFEVKHYAELMAGTAMANRLLGEAHACESALRSLSELRRLAFASELEPEEVKE